MTSLRYNRFLGWLFAALFVTQFFVPLAFASVRSGDDTFVICTSSGLKQFAADGTLVDVNPLVDINQSDDQLVGEKDCLVCLTAGLHGSFDVPPATANVYSRAGAAANANYHKLPEYLSDYKAKNFKARAPPLMA